MISSRIDRIAESRAKINSTFSRCHSFERLLPPVKKKTVLLSSRKLIKSNLNSNLITINKLTECDSMRISFLTCAKRIIVTYKYIYLRMKCTRDSKQ